MTGVQTCALPISTGMFGEAYTFGGDGSASVGQDVLYNSTDDEFTGTDDFSYCAWAKMSGSASVAGGILLPSTAGTA